MNKETILEKSRKENEYGDELYKFIEKGASACGYFCGVLAYVLLEILHKYKKFDTLSGRTMLMAMLFGSSIYTFFKSLKNGYKKYCILNGIFSLVFFILIIVHIQDILN